MVQRSGAATRAGREHPIRAGSATGFSFPQGGGTAPAQPAQFQGGVRIAGAPATIFCHSGATHAGRTAVVASVIIAPSARSRDS